MINTVAMVYLIKIRRLISIISSLWFSFVFLYPCSSRIIDFIRQWHIERFKVRGKWNGGLLPPPSSIFNYCLRWRTIAKPSNVSSNSLCWVVPRLSPSFYIACHRLENIHWIDNTWPKWVASNRGCFRLEDSRRKPWNFCLVKKEEWSSCFDINEWINEDQKLISRFSGRGRDNVKERLFVDWTLRLIPWYLCRMNSKRVERFLGGFCSRWCIEAEWQYNVPSNQITLMENLNDNHHFRYEFCVRVIAENGPTLMH